MFRPQRPHNMTNFTLCNLHCLCCDVMPHTNQSFVASSLFRQTVEPPRLQHIAKTNQTEHTPQTDKPLGVDGVESTLTLPTAPTQ